MGGMIGFLYRQFSFTPKALPSTVNLEGQMAIITRGNVGLGLEATKQLAARGLSRLILPVRTISKGETARDEIKQQTLSCDVQVWQLDQESFESIPRLTARVTGSPSRLTIVTSEVHFWSKFPEKDAPDSLARMNEVGSFGSGMERYNTSKLLNSLWLRELSNKAGPDVVNGVNPGLCASLLHRSDTTPGVEKFHKIFAWRAEQGGHNLVDAAVLHPANQGAYVSEQTVKKPSPFVLSKEVAQAQKKIWDETIA